MSMKNVAWICVLLAAYTDPQASAQMTMRLYNASLVDTSLSVVYAGVENTIVVCPWESDDPPQLAHTAEGTLHADEHSPGAFRFTPKSFRYVSDGTDTFRLIHKGRIFAERIFVGKELGWPEPRFGSLNDTIATVKDFLADPQLHATIPDCEWIGREARVIGYELKLEGSGRARVEMLKAKAGKAVRSKVESAGADGFRISLSYATDSVAEENLFTGEVTMKPERSWSENVDGPSLPLPYQELIAELKPGDRLLFSSIRSIPLGGCPIRLHDLSITIR